METWDFGEDGQIAPGLTAVRLLGGGAAYEAWLAFDEITYAPVVVKVLRPGQVHDASSLRGLRREVRALAEVNHPVVVRSLRHDVNGPRPHVVLEHVDGPRLSTLLRRYGPLQEQQYLPLAVDLASALHYLAHVGHVHLDLKPSNVIMGAPARLIDLSVARTVEEAAGLRHPVGTDAYLAPEQCDPPATGAPGPASDVWGLGATLFEAVAGHRPFDDGDPDASALVDRFPQVAVLDGGAPYALPDRVPEEVAKVVHAALAPLPRDRPRPREIAEALQPVLERQPVGHLAGFRVRR
ncbi:serine/threonine protein kinase [Nocardioides guangzhouensis]|uniref:non-specific serine/threonine protein kinase n=1 Tax=Nocardioides guangzhouensis TaxID=2497878 RepID=A0A4Q4ZDK0_9ACTN|nr:serine/threonine-protein kinase [Nocardioides guangzhouensis]RYP85818.1 serine/threonine protein kinase [Nocardioides guangzhouensis]